MSKEALTADTLNSIITITSLRSQRQKWFYEPFLPPAGQCGHDEGIPPSVQALEVVGAPGWGLWWIKIGRWQLPERRVHEWWSTAACPSTSSRGQIRVAKVITEKDDQQGGMQKQTCNPAHGEEKSEENVLGKICTESWKRREEKESQERGWRARASESSSQQPRTGWNKTLPEVPPMIINIHNSWGAPASPYIPTNLCRQIKQNFWYLSVVV